MRRLASALLNPAPRGSPADHPLARRPCPTHTANPFTEARCGGAHPFVGPSHPHATARRGQVPAWRPDRTSTSRSRRRPGAPYDTIEVYTNSTTTVAKTNDGVPGLFGALPDMTLTLGAGDFAVDSVDVSPDPLNPIPGTTRLETSKRITFSGASALTADTWVVALEPLPTGSLWRTRFPNGDALAVAARGNAFLWEPDTATLDALAAYLALESSARSESRGVSALLALRLQALELAGRHAVRSLRSSIAPWAKSLRATSTPGFEGWRGSRWDGSPGIPTDGFAAGTDGVRISSLLDDRRSDARSACFVRSCR